jgi:hypothetical protein
VCTLCTLQGGVKCTFSVCERGTSMVTPESRVLMSYRPLCKLRRLYTYRVYCLTGRAVHIRTALPAKYVVYTCRVRSHREGCLDTLTVSAMPTRSESIGRPRKGEWAAKLLRSRCQFRNVLPRASPLPVSLTVRHAARVYRAGRNARSPAVTVGIDQLLPRPGLLAEPEHAGSGEVVL